MLAIARALLGNPRVLLMDEPFEGLAPIIVEQLVSSIGAIVRDGALTLLLVEQRVDIALETLESVRRNGPWPQRVRRPLVAARR